MIYLHKIWPNYTKHVSNALPVKNLILKIQGGRSILHRHEIFQFNFVVIGRTVAEISLCWHFSNEM